MLRRASGGVPATLAWVAIVVAILDALALMLTFVVAAVAGAGSFGAADNGSWINVVAGPTFPLVAALILRNTQQGITGPVRIERLAWALLGVGGLCTAVVAVHTAADYALDRHVGGAVALAWVGSWLWTGVAPGVLLILLWFPTGDAPARAWRWVTSAAAVAAAGMWSSTALQSGPMTDYQARPANPLGWPHMQHQLAIVRSGALIALAVTAVATLASVAVRFRRGDAAVRCQLRWLLVALFVLGATIAFPAPRSFTALSVALNLAATLLLPVTLAVAVTRRPGFGLPRILVYGLLSTLLLAAYLAIVGSAQLVFGSRADRVSALLAAAGIAVVAAPLRVRLQRAVERLLYGDRGDPYAALSALGKRIAGSPTELLLEVVAAVAEALRTSYVAVYLPQEDSPAAAVGRPRSPEIVVQLSLQGAEVGALVVAHRRPDERYSARDLALLDDLARHIAVAAHAASLARDLQRSRESLVFAREEERRRIRRDLHDGLGPALAGVALGLDAARNVLDRDPAAAAAALGQLKSEVQTSLADVRRLVYDLRPPILDQLGLIAAVEEYAARLTERGGIAVKVQAPRLPALPAAVEVAAYRIITEAVANAARHSGGRRVEVELDIDDGHLLIGVIDDGVGLPAQVDGRRRGVGLTTMDERATELGGHCHVATLPARSGTIVNAWLPLRRLPLADTPNP